MNNTQWERERLEYEYSPSRWSKRGADWVIQNHIKIATEGSKLAQTFVPCELDVPYGSQPGQKLDIFGAQDLPQDAPIFIYIHGGYWQQLSRDISSYCAPSLYKSGIVVVVVGYDLAPTVKLDEIVQEIQIAVSYILKWAANRGSRSVAVGGHSAGSHLTAMLLHNEWFQNEPYSNLLTAMVHISGVFDLVPLINTYVNDALHLESNTARALSPLHLQMNNSTEMRRIVQIILAVAEYDPPEFKRQTQNYAQVLKSNGFNVETFTVGSVDHFDIVEKLMDENYQLTKTIIQVLKAIV